MSAGTQLAFFFLFSSGFQSIVTVMPTVKMGLPTSAQLKQPPQAFPEAHSLGDSRSRQVAN